MFIQNAWYAAAWEHELSQADFVARKILGKNLLMYRKSDGKVTAILNRCSHRFAPLSLGRREGDCIRCMYHGLMFDSNGKCVEEPGRKGVSPGTDIPAFPALERHKLIWVWLGDADKADPDLIPDCHQNDSPDWACKPGYASFDANYLLVLDNLLDFSHLAFVHANTLGGGRSIAEINPKVEQTESGVKMTRWYLNEPEFAPFLKGVERFEGPVDRWNIYHLSTRSNHFSMSSGSAPAGTGAPEGNFAEETMVFHSNQLITPGDENTTHYFYVLAHGFAVEDERLTALLAERLKAGFAEDKVMIEAQQRVINESDDAKMAYTHYDNGLTLGRRMIDACITREKEDA